MSLALAWTRRTLGLCRTGRADELRAEPVVELVPTFDGCTEPAPSTAWAAESAETTKLAPLASRINATED
jgi:hypothetical protein